MIAQTKESLDWVQELVGEDQKTINYHTSTTSNIATKLDKGNMLGKQVMKK